MRRWFRQGSATAGRLGHHGLRLIGTLALALMLVLGAAAWRLSRGPVDLPVLASRIGDAATRALPGMVVTIGTVGLQWEGFHRAGTPIDLHLSDISVLGRDGAVAARISGLRITLSPLELLRGRIAPIRIVARHTTIDVRPATVVPVRGAPARGTPMPALRPAAIARAAGRLIGALARPPHPGGLDLGSLRQIRIDRAALSLDAPQAGVVLTASDAAFDLTRDAGGRLRGTASARFRHGDTVAPVKVTISGHDGLGAVTARIGPVDPALLAPAQPDLARADLPVTVVARWPVGRQAAARFDLAVTAGAGHVRLGGASIAVNAIDATMTATPRRLTLDHGMIGLPGTIARLRGALDLAGGGGTIAATVDRVTAAALKADWPPAFARGARKYVVGHVAAGVARNGVFHAAFVLGGARLGGARHGPRLTGFDGRFAASGVTLDWFKAAIPMTGLAGTLDFTDMNDLAIDAASGRLGGLALKGTMTITDLTHHDQESRIDATLAGSAAAAVPLLDTPPLRLASRGVALAGTTGRLAAGIVAQVPLIRHLTLKQVTVAAAVDLTGLHLPLPIGGHPGLALEDGTVALSASTHRFSLNGRGRLAGENAKFDAAMRLPGGVLTGTAQTGIAAATVARLDGGALGWHGVAPVTARYREHRGIGRLVIRADLAPVAVAIPAIDWRKASGAPGHARVTVSLRNGRAATLRAIDIAAPALALRGTGSGGTLLIERARLDGTRATGKLTPPAAPGAPWMLALAGPVLDLSTVLKVPRPAAATRPAVPTTRPAGPAWRLQAAFDSLRLHRAPSPALGPVHIEAVGLAGTVRTLNASARTDAANQAVLRFADAGDAATFSVRAGDAGALLAAIGTTTDISGGGLVLTATTLRGTTTGRAALTDFRLRRAPVIAKVLQGLSLYGVPAATSGPGLAISRLVAPFSMSGTTIRLGNGRAYSASLGFTATGSIDTGRKRYDLSGTIVPAYAINTLPGRIPVIGRLFSPEKGSGLFAARYSVVGPFARPDITVNPLSALTPGFLREIFGVFNRPEAVGK